ncbi:MAG: adenylate kinase [Acidobacteriota bacterium]|nr:adenylate kinase [Acidobacteriota bacterium]MDH3786216.1 adenylate kinase [Acidobacteriota bacterium]
MNLIFLGPPGAGKGTQSKNLIERFDIPQISTGDIIRAAIRSGSPLGVEVAEYANTGRLVPDDLVNRLASERLADDDCRGGFLLDGYPRTVAQAEALDGVLLERGAPLDHVLLLEVDDSELLDRITGRRSDPESGRVYHVTFDPPPEDLAARLIQRPDDTAEVFGKRLREYHQKTAPLIPYYEDRGLLRRIDGRGSLGEVTERVTHAVD